MRKSGDTVVLVGDPLERETTKINNIFTKKKKKHFSISAIHSIFSFFFSFLFEKFSVLLKFKILWRVSTTAPYKIVFAF